MYEDILDRALVATFGIAISLGSRQEAQRFRRKLYSCREKLRLQGAAQYDVLSFLVKSGGELWLIPRSSVASPEVEDVSLRLLTQDELPVQILSRGKSKLVLPSCDYEEKLER